MNILMIMMVMMMVDNNGDDGGGNKNGDDIDNGGDDFNNDKIQNILRFYKYSHDMNENTNGPHVRGFRAVLEHKSLGS